MTVLSCYLRQHQMETLPKDVAGGEGERYIHEECVRIIIFSINFSFKPSIIFSQICLCSFQAILENLTTTLEKVLPIVVKLVSTRTSTSAKIQKLLARQISLTNCAGQLPCSNGPTEYKNIPVTTGNTWIDSSDFSTKECSMIHLSYQLEEYLLRIVTRMDARIIRYDLRTRGGNHFTQ